MTTNLLLLQSNSASELGGAIYSIQPSISIQDREALNVADDVFSIGDLLLETVNMSLNTANQGGCMYVTGNGANVTAVNSNFDRYALTVLASAHAVCTLRITFEQCEAASLLISAQAVVGQEHPALRSMQALLQQMLPCVINEYLRRWYISMLQTPSVLPVLTLFAPNAV